MSYSVQTLAVVRQKTATRIAIFPGQWLKQIVDRFAKSRRRRQEHKQLKNLSEHMLRDIGLTRADVENINGNLPRKLGKRPNF